jgi:hypothetical protein
MPVRSELLDNLRVASPCHVSWEGMEGDERTRHCRHCRLNVYNVSGMSRQEAETLIREKEGRLCVRFYRRRDGTVLVDDCPVGLRKARRWLVARLAGVVAALALVPLLEPLVSVEAMRIYLGLDDFPAERRMMGKIAVDDGQMVMGMVPSRDPYPPGPMPGGPDGR